MKIYLTDNQKIHIYSLPKKIEDSYLIEYTNNLSTDEVINVIAHDGKWMIQSTPEVSFYNSEKLVQSQYLENNSVLQVKFSDLEEKVTLYVYDTPMTYVEYDIGGKEEISIGRENPSTILYNCPTIASLCASIKGQSGHWLFQNCDIVRPIYINGYAIQQKYLQYGDVIFVQGLKIIWFESYIKINVPKDSLSTTLPGHQKTTFNGNKYGEITDTERASVLYNDNQIFFHTPRLKETIIDQKVQIQVPPQKDDEQKIPTILQLGGPMMMGASSSITGIIAIFNIVSGKASLASSIAEVSICIGMLFGSILFPILLDRYQKHLDKKKEKKRQIKYKAYLDKKVSEINRYMEKEKSILLENNLSIKEIQSVLIDRSNKIWSREIADTDFLSVRLGVGNIKPHITISANLEDFTLEDDNLRQDAEAIVNQQLLLEGVPITASLLEDKILPVIISDSHPNKQQYIDGLMLQIITYYSGVDLKIVVMTDELHKQKWEYLKYLPHCCSNDGEEHYFACSEEEIKSLASSLEKIRQERVKSLSGDDNNDDDIDNNKRENDPADFYKEFGTYYLIVTDNFITAKRFDFINKIVESDANLGFSILMFEDNMKNLPSQCNHFINIEQNTSGMFSKDLSEDNQKIFTAEYQMENNNEEYSRILANIPILGESSSNTLPNSYAFLEMFKVGKIEQLNITNRWLNNDPTQSLQTPIGVQPNGKLFELDLHEKAHGPHGLIAGATGSGKSEFIITYILSMAVNYHPYEVQFVLIDYKGGGLAGAFENKENGIKLPHLAGTITNLDTAEMNRTLVSIKSELKRRQRVFNEARDTLNESTVDIYKYQRFFREKKVQEPISHLFIISDEFAELKSQQPEFMDELVSIARIGRSLGVHLILATQKPAGVVDDQIWSNARFKVSLKVQTAEDSVELLKRPDAAELKTTGRFYLQVGFNEIFEIGQSAWAGAKYNPTDRITKVYEDDIEFVDNSGHSLKKINNTIKTENQVDYGDQLTNLVKALCDISSRENVLTHTLWLPSISPEIYISDLINKYQYKTSKYDLNILVGEYDDPESQLQDKLTLNLTSSGNILIYGITGAGKENLLTTILYTSCIYHSTSEINYYILDFGAEILNPFAGFPQVGDVITVIDKDKMRNHFDCIEREINKRKELFKDYGGNYSSYLKNSETKLPLIVTIINNYESFYENYMDLDDILICQLRESSKYGIIFITTVVATNAIRPSVAQLYATKVMLQIGDPFEYVFQLDAKKGLVPAKYFGRGLIKLENGTFEFQTAYVYLKDKITDTIKGVAQKLQASNMEKAPPIPNTPQNVSSETVLSEINDINAVPIGYCVDNAVVSKFNFIKNKVSFVVGNHINTEPTFLLELIKVLSAIPSVELRVMDLADNMQNCGVEECYNDEFTNFISNMLTAEKETKQKIIYIITGIGFIYDRVLDDGIKMLFDIFEGKYDLKNSYFILSDNYISMKKLEKETWYQNVNRKDGIWVGQTFNEQNIIQTNEVKSYDANQDFYGLAYNVSDGSYEVIKSIGSPDQKVGGFY